MFGRLTLSLLAILVSTIAQAADVSMGTVTLKMSPPSGYCELDPAEAGDKRMLDAVRAAVPGNDLLGISADCGELRDWRAGKRPLLEHMTQYQTMKQARTIAFTAANAQAACNDMRTKGDQINKDTLPSIKENLSKAMKQVDFHGQTLLGVTAEDPNGCYVSLVQRFKAETGKEITQLNMFFMGSIKDRLVYLYVMAPYVSDRTIDELLAFHKTNTAAMKSANGL
jgi:hypothetical protein